MSGRASQTPRLGLNKPDPGGDVDVWGDELNRNADILDNALLTVQAAALYLPIGGGTMNGPLGLAGAPIQPTHAATKAYVDAAAPAGGPYLPISGGQLTGPLALAGAPIQPTHAATKAYVDAAAPAGGPYLPIGGGQLTGPLALAGAPIQPQHAATKAYVDAGGPFLPLGGGTMTGPLTLAGAPTQPLHAVTKSYADSMPLPGGPFLPLAGGALTGALLLAADPATGLGAATKQYVDGRAPAGGPFLPLSGGTLTGPLQVTAGSNPLIVTTGTPGGLPVFQNAAMVVTGDSGQVRSYLVGFGGAPQLGFFRPGGTKANPTATAASAIVTIGAFGFDGTTWTGTANALYTQNAAVVWTPSDHSTLHTWQVTAPGSLTGGEVMRLDPNGVLMAGLLAADGAEKIQSTNGVRAPSFRVGTSAGPTITSGPGVPAFAAPACSVWLRTDGAAGARFYVNQGGTAWAATAGV